MNEDIKAVARRIWEEVFSRCQLDAPPEVIHPDWYNHAPPTDKHGLAGARKTLEQLRDAFDGLRYEVLDVIGDGDRVAVYCRATGRHTGPWQGLAATGRRFASGQVHVLRFREGRRALGCARRPRDAARPRLARRPVAVEADDRAGAGMTARTDEGNVGTIPGSYRASFRVWTAARVRLAGRGL